jgi:hypothetical protein
MTDGGIITTPADESSELERLRAKLNQCLLEANLTDAALVQRQQMFREWHEMKRELDTIAVFFRNNFARQIELGEHAGLTTSQVVIRYLGRYLGGIAGAFTEQQAQRHKE